MADYKFKNQIDMKIIYCINLFLIILCSCNIKKTNNMTEKYDFETVKSSTTYPCVVDKGNRIILMYSMTESGAHYVEYSTSISFYKIVKNFHPNGMLKSKGTIVGSDFSVGYWQYFDEKGNLIKEEDEDKKFGKIKIDWILKFLEKEGWINLTTGEGREYPIIDDKYVEIQSCRFYLSFIQKGKDIPVTKNDPPHLWVVSIPTAKWNNYTQTIYHIDGDTGEVLNKKYYHSPIKI